MFPDPLTISLDEAELLDNHGFTLAFTCPDLVAEVKWIKDAWEVTDVLFKDRAKGRPGYCPQISLLDPSDPLRLGIAHAVRQWAATPAGQKHIEFEAECDAEQRRLDEPDRRWPMGRVA